MEETMEDILEATFHKVNSEDTFARQIGMKLVELQSGFARAVLPVTAQSVNIYQMAHGGAIFSVADQACEAAGNSFGEPAVVIQHNIHFLSAGKSGDLLDATARVTHRTNRIGLIEFEVKNQEGLLLAIGQQVFYLKRGIWTKAVSRTSPQVETLPWLVGFDHKKEYPIYYLGQNLSNVALAV